MYIINALMEFIITALDTILPVLGFSPDFLQQVDNGIIVLIDLIEGANYFLPLDVMVICWGAMLAVDHFALLMRIGQWFIKTVRG